jgi:protein ImuB
VPLFPLAARLRCEPGLAREAVVVCAGNGHAARVVAANRLARRAGIRPGETLRQARALMPGLVARGRDVASERAAQEALLEVAETFSPRVEDAGEGVVYLDTTGDPAPETEIAQALARAAERAGLPARVGVASSKLAARVAADSATSPNLVGPGEEARFLAPLPLARLTPALELAETLRRWGLRSIGDFARLSADEIASRLGAAGADLHAIARGEDPRPLVARTPPPDFREGIDLEWPLVALEPFLFVGHAALERLTARLAARGLGCLRLLITLRLDPDGVAERAIDLPAPTRDAKTLLTLVKLELEKNPPGAPVVGFTFAALPDRPRNAQLTLLGVPELSPDLLATTLARLFALLGPGRAGTPHSPDGHRPERFEVLPYGEKVGTGTTLSRGLLTVRVLRPPIELEVLAADITARPSSLRSLTDENGSSRPRLEGAVRVAAGPWRLEDGWWSEGPANREYWDLELDGGGLYRVYRDLASERWFADGMYD